MTDGRGSLTSPLALVAAVLAAVAIALVGAAATGAMPGVGGDAQPDGETVIDRAEQRYANAETVVGDATITVANDTTERSVNLSYVFAGQDRARVGVGDRFAVGTNGSVAWASADGVVLSAPVPDANRSVPPSDDAAVGNWSDLNRSALTERVLALVGTNRSTSLPVDPSAGVLANWSHEGGANWTDNGLPANWSETVPANWSEKLPANWSAGDLPGNWSEKLPANWSASEYPGNGSERRIAIAANRTDSWVENASDSGERNYTTELTGTTTVDGREAYVLSVDRANATTPWNVTLWVDTEDYRFHRVEATYRESRLTVDFDTTINASVRNSTFRPPDDAAFELAGQASYDTFDAAQANTSVTLGRLGGDYAFVNATVATRSGVTVAAQQYADGDKTAALVSTAGTLPFDFGEGETVTVDGANATYVERGDRSVVVWERDGVTRAVVADLPRGELVVLAESATV